MTAHKAFPSEQLRLHSKTITSLQLQLDLAWLKPECHHTAEAAPHPLCLPSSLSSKDSAIVV